MFDYVLIRIMFDKIKEFYLLLCYYGDDDVEELLVGLWLVCRGDICLEWDFVCFFVLYNYGYGGLGVMFFWGCVGEVCVLIDYVIKRWRLIYVLKLWILKREFCGKIIWWWNVFMINFLFIVVVRWKLLWR